MKLLGVQRIISVSAVGSLQENLRPGEFLVPDQFFDSTKRPHLDVLGNGLVAHVAFDKLHVHNFPPCSPTRASPRLSRFTAREPTSTWKARSFRRLPKRISTEP